MSASQQSVAMLEGELDPQIPDGEYLVFFSHWETSWRRGWAPKLYVWFFIAEGEYRSVLLRRCYNVKHVSMPVGERGGFTVGRKSDYYREFVTCLGAPEVGSILPERFGSCFVLAEVGTVERGSKGEVLPESLRYSTIRKLKPLPAVASISHPT